MKTTPTNPIPVNILTGFLGVGKTTVIRHLLKTKPADEKWAVLVNEFGEVGIDGAILAVDGIAVEEVTGGCICCSVRLPSSLALLKLIEEIKPDRIIIEPTGLAVPAQILAMLENEKLAGKILTQAIVCLIDPWCLQDKTFLSMPAFAEQIMAADVVISTKSDTASTAHLKAFEDYTASLQPRKQAYQAIAHGELDWNLLCLPHSTIQAQPKPHSHSAQSANTHHHVTAHNEAAETEFEPDSQGVARIENEAEFGFSCGWQFDQQWRFDLQKLTTLFASLPIPRIKGVLATEQGWMIINKMRATISSETIDSATDSRLEMISLTPLDWHEVDEQLRLCGVG